MFYAVAENILLDQNEQNLVIHKYIVINKNVNTKYLKKPKPLDFRP